MKIVIYDKEADSSHRIIYALFCVCATNDIRYVGYTVKSGLARLDGHIARAISGSTYPVYQWMRKHGMHGIGVRTLEIVDPSEDLGQAEIRWIASTRGAGNRLLNCNDGGLGGVNPSPEIRAKIGKANSGPHPSRVGIPLSEATRKKISEKAKGRTTWSKGKTFTKEHRAKIGAKHRGKVTPTHVKEALRAANLGKKRGPRSAETKAKISAGHLKLKGYGAHIRWHINRGLVSPVCEHCGGDS